MRGFDSRFDPIKGISRIGSRSLHRPQSISLMTSTVIEALVSFSRQVQGTIRDHMKPRDGDYVPSILAKKMEVAKAHFPGSVLELHDGSLRAIPLTRGVIASKEVGFTLGVGALTGGQVKHYEPESMGLLVKSVALGCLSDSGFEAPRPSPPLTRAA